MIYKIILSEAAEWDMAEIHQYISDELFSPEAADKLLDEFERNILDLEHMPKKYALVPNEKLARKGIRFIPVKNYIIFYFADEKSVTIVRVIYGRRDWRNIV
jgi:toxin ParE1/3/4